MTTSKPNFRNGMIYRIKCKDKRVKATYVGSTCDYEQRKISHQNACHNESHMHHEYPLYQFMRKRGNWENWLMEPLEWYPCKNANELHLKEQEWINKLKPKLNTIASIGEEK